MEKWRYPTHKSFIVDMNNDPYTPPINDPDVPDNGRHQKMSGEDKEAQTLANELLSTANQKVGDSSSHDPNSTTKQEVESSSRDPKPEVYKMRIPVKYNAERVRTVDKATALFDRWIAPIGFFLLALVCLGMLIWIGQVENKVEELYEIVRNTTCNYYYTESLIEYD